MNQGSQFTTYESRLAAHGLWWTIPTVRPLRTPVTDAHVRWSEGQTIAPLAAVVNETGNHTYHKYFIH